MTSQRVQAIRVIAKRDIRATVFGLGIYIAASIAFLVATFFVRSSIMGVHQNGLMVMTNPLNFPLFIAVIIGATYLALTSTISVTRERDQGTLEVLFYGPLDGTTYLLAKFVEQIVIFLGLAIVYVLLFSAISAMTNLGIDSSFVATAGLSVPLAASIVAFGLFLSTLAGSTRNSVLLLVGLLVVFLGFDVVSTIFGRMPTQGLSPTVIFARMAVNVVNQGLQWISPFGYLNRGLTAVQIGDLGQILISILGTVIYTSILLVLAVRFLARKGVRK